MRKSLWRYSRVVLILTLCLKAISQKGNPQQVEHAHTFDIKKNQCVFMVRCSHSVLEMETVTQRPKYPNFEWNNTCVRFQYVSWNFFKLQESCFYSAIISNFCIVSGLFFKEIYTWYDPCIYIYEDSYWFMWLQI